MMLLGACAASVLTACSEQGIKPSDALTSAGQSAFDVTVHRTEGGIPHVIANDWGSLGYGQAYAASEDHFCELARNILTYRAQLSEYFGPSDGNLESDLFFKLQSQVGLYDHIIDTEFDAMFVGYAAGFNRYARDHAPDRISDPACNGAKWLPRMTPQDVRRIHLMPAFLPALSSLIVAATPPSSDVSAAKNTAGQSAITPPSQQLAVMTQRLIDAADKGSNGVAIGSELSTDGSGLLYTNPHLNWTDFDFRMYGFHHIIPGVTNLLGANAAQRANVGFGTNGHVAWTNTVSTAMDFTFYQLDLDPNNPRAYIFDGEQREIEAVPVSVKVRQPDGNVVQHNHTFYRSHHGWMVGGSFAWQNSVGFSLRIADEGARVFQGGTLAFIKAKNVRELKAANNRFQSSAGVNTIAADSSGEVLYGDLGPVVNLTDQQLSECRVHGLVMRGNTSDCEWNVAADAAAAGLVGASEQPFLFRRDYVTNSNDSYWLANPAAPLTGFAAVQGDTNTQRRMRTRSGLALIAARSHGSDGLSGNKFDLQSLQQRMLSNQSVAGQILRDDLVALCHANPVVVVDGIDIDISEACAVLANWDLHTNLDSRGAHLFREFIRAVRTPQDGRGSVPQALKLRIAFDPEQPLATPRGLATDDNPVALTGLASAVQVLRAAGIALDARLGDIQGVTRNGQRIPLHGGDDMEGVFNKMALDLNGANGYDQVTGSSGSWIMVTRVAGDATQVQGLTTYSQSSDPTSPHYADLTKRFSKKELVAIPFLQKDVEDAALRTLKLDEGAANCTGRGWRAYREPAFSNLDECRMYFTGLALNKLTGFAVPVP